MPKPRAEVNGSGMHIHFSLFKDGRNVFVNPGNPQELSEEAYYFVGGLLAHSKEMALITNPIVNSYKRLVPGYEAPVYIAWSAKNRTPLIRVPSSRGASARIELRSPDPAANPYLALAVCLAAGLDGIRNEIMPPESIDVNIFTMDKEERKNANIESLPGSLLEAAHEFEKDRYIKEVLGKDLSEKFLAAKKKEYQDYRSQVTDWEIQKYLHVM